MTERSAHLADRIEARRVELGYTITGLVAATGLTQQALKNIRNGERRQYQDRLTMPLTRALGWTPDSISRLLDGLEPVEVVAAADSPGAPVDLAARLDQIEAKIDLAVEGVAGNTTKLFTLLDLFAKLARERREGVEASPPAAAGR